MSHVLGEKAVASQIKSIAKTGTAKMMGPTMGEMGMGSMMSGSMGPMMSEGMGTMMKEGMGPMMMGSMGPMMKPPGVTTGIATGIVASARKRAITRVFKHPLVLFGLGVVVGCYVYKYRKSIISASDEAQ
jgi:hypothetical protein